LKGEKRKKDLEGGGEKGKRRSSLTSGGKRKGERRSLRGKEYFEKKKTGEAVTTILLERKKRRGEKKVGHDYNMYLKKERSGEEESRPGPDGKEKKGRLPHLL